MIYYFTGTGNSKWAAETIAEKTNDTVARIVDVTDFKTSDNKVGIVFPIYAWGTPAPVDEFLKKFSFESSQYVYIIAVCGANCGTVEKQIEKVIKRPVNASLSIALPNNYIQGGSCDSKATAKKMFKKAKPQVDALAEAINNKDSFCDMTRGPLPHITSTAVHTAFIKYACSDKSYNVIADKCNGCGTCERVCPLQNVRLADGKPTWNGNCCACTACINNCPTEAIQYGKHSEARRRYHFTQDIVE